MKIIEIPPSLTRLGLEIASTRGVNGPQLSCFSQEFLRPTTAKSMPIEPAPPAAAPPALCDATAATAAEEHSSESGSEELELGEPGGVELDQLPLA